MNPKRPNPASSNGERTAPGTAEVSSYAVVDNLDKGRIVSAIRS